MRGEFKIRKVCTASGSTAVQIIRYVSGKRIIVKHIGSAKTNDEIAVLCQEAERLREQLSQQLLLFPLRTTHTNLLHEEHLQLQSVTHVFAYKILRQCSKLCALGEMNSLFQDLALMRIIEPTSKLRTIDLLQRYFGVTHARRTVCRLLPQLLNQKEAIEEAAYQTACSHFGEAFVLILYDVTTLYFESHEPDDDLKARGFSKDDKSKQPQIVVGLLVTPQGFPLMHEIYKGNTFEGHTMLSVVNQFQKRHPKTNPIIVADAAMLSQDNMNHLDREGYWYIVGGRLANTSTSFIHQIDVQLERTDGRNIRLTYPNRSYDVICCYSDKRAQKDRREMRNQLARAQNLIARKESGRRAKFVKKSPKLSDAFILDEKLIEKTEKLLGIKGYVTNIPKEVLSNEQIIAHYHELWHVEQGFRMSKTDLKTRPIFHHAHQAIKAHLLLCFMALMMGKFLEIKTGISLRKIRDILWNIHEVQILDSFTGKTISLQTNLEEFNKSTLYEFFKPH
jgi:transposase